MNPFSKKYDKTRSPKIDHKSALNLIETLEKNSVPVCVCGHYFPDHIVDGCGNRCSGMRIKRFKGHKKVRYCRCRGFKGGIK